jgi:hypothetical protein
LPFRDEGRIGWKNGIARQWQDAPHVRGSPPTGAMPRLSAQAHPFARDRVAASALPFADTEAVKLHIDEISRCRR